MAKLSFLAGFGAGYVLGARAGRERYEQIRRAYHSAKSRLGQEPSPRVGTPAPRPGTGAASGPGTVPGPR